MKDENALPDGWVPTNYYFLCDFDLIVGICSIRLKDSDFVLNYSGHIGYAIAPWYRKRGYGRKALELLLIEAKKLQLNQVILTCDVSNIGSSKIIKYNGGIYNNTVSTKLVTKQIYTIEL